MFNITNIVIALVVVLILNGTEYFLAKTSWLLGLILPIAALIIALLIDLNILLLTALLVVVFAVALFIKQKQGRKQKEIDKMSIQDLG